MADFDERKTPLTLDNIRVWADAKFPRAFRALPGVAKVSFLEFDDAKFESDRSIERSIKRSEHKKLLMIGKYAPESEDEEEFACAIVHANDYNVSYYRIKRPESGKNKLHAITSARHIVFDPPFSAVGDRDDDGDDDGQTVRRIRAIIFYYFLAAGLINELDRWPRHEKWFTKGFEDACHWIENKGERPPKIRRPRTITDKGSENSEDNAPAINRSVQRAATREKSTAAPKRDGDTIDVQSKPPSKRPIRDSLSAKPPRKSLRQSSVLERLNRPPDEAESLRAQIAILTADNETLKEELRMQGHTLRGCELIHEETKQDLEKERAKLKESEDRRRALEASLRNIQELTGKALA